MGDAVPQVRVSITLPYLLRLPDGLYQTGSEGGAISLTEQYVSGGDSLSVKHTSISSVFDAPALLQPEQQVEVQRKEFGRLLRQTNRLIRWYRSETRQAAVVELTKSQAGPPSFIEVNAGLTWGSPLLVEPDPPLPSAHFNSKSIAKSVRKGLAGTADPEVASLFLLDAEQARRDGRFREVVLFCWSTIDATFNTKYEQLVDQALVGEWAAGREWLKDTRFGMKNKMSAVLFLTMGRSLFREPDGFWDGLSKSYTKRNKIIHAGETAQEEDAEAALLIAHQVVELMASLKPKKHRRQNIERNTA